MSSREPLRRSPRKRPPRREERSSYRKRSDAKTDTRRKQNPRRDKAQTKTETPKKVEKTFLDEKFDLYSAKNNPELEQKTDIMSDDFDPVAFLYSDIEPLHTENGSDVRAADCVQMLLAKWDREDGIVTGF